MLKIFILALTITALFTPALVRAETESVKSATPAFDGYTSQRLAYFLHQGILFRRPTSGALHYWGNIIEKGGMDGLLSAAKGMAGSQEFTNQVLPNYGSKKVIANAYRVFFKRKIDQDAEKWISGLEAGHATDVFAEIVSTTEFAEKNF